MRTKAIALSLTAATLLSLTTAVYADGQACTGPYGAAVACPPVNLLIDKSVKNPITGQFVANLDNSTPVSRGSEVLFQLVIKNTSGETFAPVTVTDTLPNEVTFVSGPGTLSGQTLTFTLDNLPAGKTETREILAKVKSDAPAGCVDNIAKVTAPARPDGDEDRAQFCITAAAGQLPVAGFNEIALLLPFAGIGLTGIALLKKSGFGSNRDERG